MDQITDEQEGVVNELTHAGNQTAIINRSNWTIRSHNVTSWLRYIVYQDDSGATNANEGQLGTQCGSRKLLHVGQVKRTRMHKADWVELKAILSRSVISQHGSMNHSLERLCVLAYIRTCEQKHVKAYSCLAVGSKNGSTPLKITRVSPWESKFPLLLTCSVDLDPDEKDASHWHSQDVCLSKYMLLFKNTKQCRKIQLLLSRHRILTGLQLIFSWWITN